MFSVLITFTHVHISMIEYEFRILEDGKSNIEYYSSYFIYPSETYQNNHHYFSRYTVRNIHYFHTRSHILVFFPAWGDCGRRGGSNIRYIK